MISNLKHVPWGNDGSYEASAISRTRISNGEGFIVITTPSVFRTEALPGLGAPEPRDQWECHGLVMRIIYSVSFIFAVGGSSSALHLSSPRGNWS